MTTPTDTMRSLNLALAAILLSSAPAAAQPISGMSEGQTMLLIVLGLVVVLTAIGGYLIYAGLKNRRLSSASELWPTAGGTVLDSKVTKRTYRNPKNRLTSTYYAPQVRYAYKVGGTGYESAVIRFGDLETGSTKVAEEIVAKYPPGATIAVRYDPQAPSRATLETQSAGGAQIATGIMFIVIPLVVAIGTAFLMYLVGGGPDLPPEIREQLNQPN